MSDTRNVKLGVCKVYYDGVDLGYTKGGVEVTVTTETHKVEVDQFGKSPINELIMSRDARVKCPLAETTLANLVSIMPGATLVTGGGASRVDVEHSIGTDLLTIAKPLILHPQNLLAADLTEDFTLLLAGTGGQLQFAYKLEEERIFNIEFTGYPSSQTRRLFVVGDLTTNAIAAVFDPATDRVTITAHGLVAGQGVVFSAVAFPDVAGIAYGKMYYAGIIDANTITLHTSAAAAILGTGDLLFTTAGTTVKAIAV